MSPGKTPARQPYKTSDGKPFDLLEDAIEHAIALQTKRPGVERIAKNGKFIIELLPAIVEASV